MMKRREWIIAGLGLLLFWTVAALVLAPRLERRLNAAAAQLLSQLDAEAGGARFDRVKVWFDGQRAKVNGAVRNDADARRLVSALREELRTPGNRWNPVMAVEAEAGLEVRPLESGWLVAALRGYEVKVVGVCATSAERDALEAGLRERWPIWRGEMVSALTLEPRRFDEAVKWAKTVDSLPRPVGRGKRAARLLVARIGEEWAELPLTEGAQPLSTWAAVGATASEWKERVQPLVAHGRQHLLAETAWEDEQERLSRLPPPHVFLGRRGEQVLLRGEVYDLAAKRAVLASVMATLPGKQILDDLRADGKRRPAPGVGLLETAAGSDGGKAFALGLSGQNWVALDWQVDSEAMPWAEALPEGLVADDVKGDSVVVIDWLQGAKAGIPVLPAPPKPAFLTLAAFAGRVVVGGQLAEEGLRAQVLEGVKRAYPTGWVLRDEIAISGRCVASESVQHTVQSVPVPNPPEQVVLAVALPGYSWRLLPHAMLADLEVLKTAALLPKTLQAPTVAASLSEVLEEMRALGISFPQVKMDGMKKHHAKP